MSRIKSIIRKLLEENVSKYGYKLEKVQVNTSYNELMNIQKNFSKDFVEEDFKNRPTDRITLSWIIPPLGPGSGGHTTIFRCIKALTCNGIHSKIFIYGGNESIPSDALKKTVYEYYGFKLDDEEIYASVSLMDYSDVAIATSWITAYILQRFNNCTEKMYFVQDFEPCFYPMGSNYRLAENTYKMGYTAVTAGKWLESKLKDEYGMITYGFNFSYDRSIYKQMELPRKNNRIFFYARPYTDRRGFELGLIALKNLHQAHPDLEIVMAGQNLGGMDLGFPYIDRGIISPGELASEYAQANMCLVMSMSNLSLLPLEVMATGSVCVTNKGDNNEWILDDSNSVLIDNDPMQIFERMDYFLNHQEELEVIRINGLNYVQHFDWDEEFKKVADFIKDRANNSIKDKMV